MNRKDVTADLSEKVAKKLRRQFAIVAQEVWVDPDHRVDFVAFSPGSGGRNAALEHGKFVFVEVKSCMADFKSGHGLTFFGLGSRTDYEKALLVGLFDRTFTCLDHRISASDEAAGPTRRPVAVVMRRDGRLQEVDPWKVVIDDSEEVFEMYSWMWDEESVVCEQLGLAEVRAEKGDDD